MSKLSAAVGKPSAAAVGEPSAAAVGKPSVTQLSAAVGKPSAAAVGKPSAESKTELHKRVAAREEASTQGHKRRQDMYNVKRSDVTNVYRVTRDHVLREFMC